MNRRTFLARTLQSGAAAAAAPFLVAPSRGRPVPAAGARPALRAEPFRLAYAPHFGMFRESAGDDRLDQLRFGADQGFRAWEDNGMTGRPVAEQERIAKEMERLEMRMGVFVVNPKTAWRCTFAAGDETARDAFLEECRAAVDVARRVRATWMTVVPGTRAPRLKPEIQLANVIDQLRRAAEIFEPHGLVMVLEPLNPWRDHPGMVLATIAQASLICRAVRSPSCKILFDVYHQQVTEGNLIPSIDGAGDDIAYFQLGDNPGRNEPTTGEIHFQNVLGHLHARGYDGILGMEHGASRPGAEGERAILDAYRWCDGF